MTVRDALCTAVALGLMTCGGITCAPKESDEAEQAVSLRILPSDTWWDSLIGVSPLPIHADGDEKIDFIIWTVRNHQPTLELVSPGQRRSLWQQPFAAAGPTIRVGDQVIAAHGTSVTSLRAWDGSFLWTMPIPEDDAVTDLCLTDKKLFIRYNTRSRVFIEPRSDHGWEKSPIGYWVEMDLDTQRTTPIDAPSGRCLPMWSTGRARANMEFASARSPEWQWLDVVHPEWEVEWIARESPTSPWWVLSTVPIARAEDGGKAAALYGHFVAVSYYTHLPFDGVASLCAGSLVQAPFSGGWHRYSVDGKAATSASTPPVTSLVCTGEWVLVTTEHSVLGYDVNSGALRFAVGPPTVDDEGF